MEVKIVAEIYYEDEDLVFLIKNDYQSKLYLEENNAIIGTFMLNHYYEYFDIMRIEVNIYLSPIITSNKITFNRNMIEGIINTLRCIYKKFSYDNKKMYNTDPLVLLIGRSDAIRSGCFNFVDDRMDDRDTIHIDNCCVYTPIGFTYSCHLYDESTIKWI